MSKSGLTLIKEFFGTERPVTTEELRRLTKEDRAELADSIAVQQGLTRTVENGSPVYN